jgi:holo-[acyl-carrier protein] synthase
MIFGIGTDIVQVGRMERILAQRGERFARRILSDREYGEFQRARRPAHFLAKRFAAKEATAKAMGTGFRGGLHLRHIGVSRDGNGRPLLEFDGYAAEFVRSHAIRTAHVSLADEREYAVAFVTLSTD